MESNSIQFTCPKTWFTWPGTWRPSLLPDWDENHQPALQPHDVYPATGYPGACMYSQTSGSGACNSGWLSKEPVVHQRIHTHSTRCIFETTLVLTQLSFSWGSSLPLSSLSNNQQPGHHKGGRQTSAKDATISSRVTYPCWYAGWINHNCFQAILIHASHKCRMKCVQQLCTWCACCTAANPVHMLKILHVKHIQKRDSPQKPRGEKSNNNNGCLWL